MSKPRKMNKNSDSQPTAVNLICDGTSIKGDVQATKDIRIDGYLNGNLQVGGKAVIGNTGKIEGAVICKTIDILGKIEGTITASESIHLKSSALVLGDVTTNRISIEPGAKFTGSCKMGEATASSKEHDKRK